MTKQEVERDIKVILMAKRRRIKKDRNPLDNHVNRMLCGVCRTLLYQNGMRKELPIVCECGESRIDHDGKKGLIYTNIITEIDGKYYGLE